MKYTSGGFGNQYCTPGTGTNQTGSGLKEFGKAGARKLNKAGARLRKKRKKRKKKATKVMLKLLNFLKHFSLSAVLVTVFFALCFYGSGENEGKTQSYIDNNNKIKNGVITYSNANANCKAYYQCVAKTTIYQEITEADGSRVLIDRTDDRYKYDYFHRGEDFYLEPDLLYCLNDFIFGEHYVYPEAFTKPVAYDEETYELLDIVDDNRRVTVKSQVLNEYGQPLGVTQSSVSDYGLSTVCTYTTFTKSHILAGTYVKKDVFNPSTGKVELHQIEEPFHIVLDSETHDILDKVVTYAGTIDYDYRETYVLQDAFIEGSESDNENDNVEKVLYDTISVTTYSATNQEGEKLTYMVSADSNGNVTGNVEKFVEDCEAAGYNMDMDGSEYAKETSEIKLYKYRSAESGIHLSSVTPLNSSSEENNNEYLYDYLSVFSTYKPLIKRSYNTLRSMTSQANISSYQAYVSQSSGTQAADINDPVILELGQAASRDMGESGILASFTVAQALLESGYGNGSCSELALDYNNWFGIKAGTDWQGETVTFSTRELDASGGEYYTDASWCVFPDRLSSLQYHSLFLWNTTNGISYRYRDCAGLTDYREICQVLKNGGYFTEDLDVYTNGIIALVNKYDLTRFDTGEWDGSPPSYASDYGYENNTFDSVTLKASTSLNSKDKEVFYDFFHATDDIFDGNTRFNYYKKYLSTSETEKLLRKTNSFINQTTLSNENMTNNLWETGYLTDLSNNKRKLRYDGEKAEVIALIAASHLGKTHEEFTTRFYGQPNNVAWCAIFVWCVFDEADATSCIGDVNKENDPIHYLEDDSGNNIVTPTTFAKAYYEWGVKTNRLVDDYEGECGDIAVFCWGHEQPCYDHTGIIVENLGNGQYRTIEGNDNGICTERIRSVDTMVGIIRPNY